MEHLHCISTHRRAKSNRDRTHVLSGYYTEGEIIYNQFWEDFGQSERRRRKALANHLHIEFRYYEPLAVGHGNPSVDFAKKNGGRGFRGRATAPQRAKDRIIDFGGSEAEMKEVAIAFGLARRTPLGLGKNTECVSRDLENSTGMSLISAISVSGSWRLMMDHEVEL